MDVGGIGTLGGAEDAIAHLEPALSLFLSLYRGSRNGQNGTCEFGAPDPWQRRLVLILALNLEQVEEIGAGGVNFDQVVIGGRRGCRKIGDGEVKRALEQPDNSVIYPIDQGPIPAP